MVVVAAFKGWQAKDILGKKPSLISVARAESTTNRQTDNRAYTRTYSHKRIMTQVPLLQLLLLVLELLRSTDLDAQETPEVGGSSRGLPASQGRNSVDICSTSANPVFIEQALWYWLRDSLFAGDLLATHALLTTSNKGTQRPRTGQQRGSSKCLLIRKEKRRSCEVRGYTAGPQ